MQIIIPMTGYGSRFINAGYKELKPFINVFNTTIIEWIVRRMYNINDKFIFICRKEHLETISGMEVYLLNLAKNVEILTVPDWEKMGPVFDILKVSDFIDNDSATIVNYCDFYMVWNYNEFLRNITDNNYDGAIPCYTGFHPNLVPKNNVYASCNVDENSHLIEIREKYSFDKDKRKTHHSSGTYFFKSGSIMKKYFQRLVNDKDMVNDEYYVSLVYNNMVKDGLKVLVPDNVEFFCQWGTPEDLEDFLFWNNNILNWRD